MIRRRLAAALAALAVVGLVCWQGCTTDAIDFVEGPDCEEQSTQFPGGISCVACRYEGKSCLVCYDGSDRVYKDTCRGVYPGKDGFTYIKDGGR